MSGRILMTTVAALALTLPAMAQDKAVPLETEQKASPQMEQAEQGGQQEEGAGEGTEQAPTMAEEAPEATTEQPGTTEQPPSMAEEAPEGTTEPAPTMAQEPPAEAAGEEMAAEEAQPPADMKFIQVQEEAQFLANDEVIGASVVNAKDQEVGEIADLVMDQDQKLVGVVLSVGGFLGVGDKWVAVPVEQISFPSADQPARLLAPVNEEQLTNAPDFITREAIESQEEAEAQQSQATQQQQVPSPTAPVQ